MRSPGLAPERRTACAGRNLAGNDDVCRDLRSRRNVAACELDFVAARPKPAGRAESRLSRLAGKSAGSPKDRKQASGSPPMAAMSLRPRVRQRCPTAAGGCQARRKCTFSRQRSVVTRSSKPGLRRRMAQSSPMPIFTAAIHRRGSHSPNLPNQASFSDHGIQQLYQNQRLTMTSRALDAPRGSNRRFVRKTENPVGMSMERKDMAPTCFIFSPEQPTFVTPTNRFMALTVPEWLVKVIQHFIVPLARVISDQRRKGILTGRGPASFKKRTSRTY